MRLPKHPYASATSIARPVDYRRAGEPLVPLRGKGRRELWRVSAATLHAAIVRRGLREGVQRGRDCRPRAQLHERKLHAHRAPPSAGCGDGKVCSLGGSCGDPTPRRRPEPLAVPVIRSVLPASIAGGIALPTRVRTDVPCPEGTGCGTTSTCGPVQR